MTHNQTKICAQIDEIFSKNKLMGYKNRLMSNGQMSISDGYVLSISGGNCRILRRCKLVLIKSNKYGYRYEIAPNELNKIPNRGAHFEFIRFDIKNLRIGIKI